MARVTGIGGVFFRSADPQALHEWYVEHLGLSPENPGFVVMSWGDAGGTTVWAPFAADTDYFGSANQWMVNYRVDDLDGLLSQTPRRGSPGRRRNHGGRERQVRLVLGFRGQQDRAMGAATW